MGREDGSHFGRSSMRHSGDRSVRQKWVVQGFSTPTSSMLDGLVYVEGPSEVLRLFCLGCPFVRDLTT